MVLQPSSRSRQGGGTCTATFIKTLQKRLDYMGGSVLRSRIKEVRTRLEHQKTYPPRSPHELKKIAKDAARHAKLASEEAQTSKDKLSEVARISEQSAAGAARLADECNLLQSEL